MKALFLFPVFFFFCVCVSMCVCVRVYVCACVRACVTVSERERDNWERLHSPLPPNSYFHSILWMENLLPLDGIVKVNFIFVGLNGWIASKCKWQQQKSEYSPCFTSAEIIWNGVHVGVAPRFSTDSCTRTRKHRTCAELHETVSRYEHTGRLAKKVCSLLLSKSGAIWHCTVPKSGGEVQIIARLETPPLLLAVE